MRLAGWCGRAALALALLALLVPRAHGQTASSLNGRISDPSGAAVPGATISLTNSATGLARTTTTNTQGLYAFLAVPPGDYSLQVTSRGFAKYLVQHVTLLVSTASTLNVALRLAKVTSTVVVQGGAPLINRTDASLGNTFEEGQLAQLPVADRDVAHLLSLQAGVAYLGTKLETSVSDTRSGAVNGLRSDQNNLTLDGADINDVNNGYAFTGVLYVPPDSVQEFRVTTANANSSSGYSSGAQVAMVTKSGTNHFHGSAYEYNRNTIFSANDTFLKAAQLASGEPNKRPKLLRNVFGGTLGGPILHNRLFFFANYEGRRDAQGESELRTVPTTTLRDGIIEYKCADPTQCPGGNAKGVSGTNYAVAPGNFALSQAQGQLQQMDPNGVGADSAVLKLLQQYPNPNDTTVGDGLNIEGYRFASKEDARFDTFITRVDYHLTRSGSESLFWRGQTQNTKQPGAQQFPGQIAATTLLNGSKGSIVGLNSVLSAALVNTFHWDLIRQGETDAGYSLDPAIDLSSIDNLYPFTRSTSFIVPVNELSDTLNWIRGNHALSFGTDLFITRDNRLSYAKSFSDARMNLAYLNTTGIVCTSNLSSPLNPANNGFPAVDSDFACSGYDPATILEYGILPQGDGFYNYTSSGQALAQGAPVRRRYALNDYEFFGQDAWRITPNLTFTYGLRWLLEAPPYETNGNEVIPCVLTSSSACSGQYLASWMQKSAQLAKQGIPSINAGELGFFLGGPANHGPGFWNWDYHDFSPRLAVAWAPDLGNGWLAKVFGRKNEFSIRGGYSIVYDHFGMPIVNTFDQNGSFGLTSDIGDAAGAAANTVAALPRFTCLVPSSASQSCLPTPCPSLSGPGCILETAPPGGFPVIPTSGNFAINWGLDSSLQTPYAHEFNLTLERQFGQSSSLQIAYVGTIARRLPMQVDEGMPTDLVDPASGMDYFTAAKMLSQEVVSGASTSQVKPIPFWQDLFPGWSTMTQSSLDSQGLNCIGDDAPGALTATQAMYDFWGCNLYNETFSLFILDTPSSVSGYSVPNSKFGPYAFYHDQFSSLTAWRNIGTSDYHALQVTYNARWSNNLIGQFNYTFSKSLDEFSAAGRIGAWEGSGGTGNDVNGGGIVINTWDPLALRGLSSFNAFHQINANWVYRLPFGRGQMLGRGANSWLNEIIGGWQFSGLFRWTSGFPTSVDNGGFWPTNWNIEGLANAVVNGQLPKASNPSNAVVNGQSIGPDIFADPTAAEAAFRHSWPGESGTRNNIIGEGMFNIDTGLAKDFSLGESRRVEFSWQTFNTTNSVRYDVRTAMPTLRELPSQFGKYTSTLTQPRFMQFALRFAF